MNISSLIPKLVIADKKTGAVPIFFLENTKLDSLKTSLSKAGLNFAKKSGFMGAKGKHCLVPNEKGDLEAVLFGYGDASDPRDTGALSRVLPKGNYYFASKASNMHLACLGFLLGAYKFDK
ncbi:MAG: hypothetical protein AB8B49_01150, partial [Nitratireductor sp.]